MPKTKRIDRNRIRKCIAKAVSTMIDLPEEKIVEGKILKLGHTIVVAVKGRLCLLELAFGSAGVSGVGEFDLSVLGCDIIDALGCFGTFSQAEVDEAWAMVREHRDIRDKKAEIRRMYDFAERHGYTVQKRSKKTKSKNSQ